MSIGRLVASLVVVAVSATAGACAEPEMRVSIGDDGWLFSGGNVALCELILTGSGPTLDVDATDDAGNVLQLTWSSDDPTFGKAELDIAGSPAFWSAANQDPAATALRFEGLDGRTVRLAGRFTKGGAAAGGEADGAIEATCPD